MDQLLGRTNHIDTQCNQIADHQGNSGFSIIENQRSGLQLIMNMNSSSGDESTHQIAAQRRSDIDSSRTGQQFTTPGLG
jgi:hypothetical protein